MVVRSAALVLVALVVTACGPGTPAVAPLEQASASPLESPVDSEPTPEPTAPAESTAPVVTPPAAAVAGPGFESVPATNLSVPDELFPIAMAADGQRLLVSGPHPDGVACEESEPYALQLFDLDTADVEPALDPALGFTTVDRGLGDTVLLSAGCEGFIQEVALGREQADGRLVDVRPVAIPEASDDFAVLTGVTLGPDGSIRWAIAGAGTELVTTDPNGVETAPRIRADFAAYDLRATSTTTYAVTFEGDPGIVDLGTGQRFAGFGSAVADVALDRVVLAGDAGVAVVGPNGELDVWVDDPVGDDVRWSPGDFISDVMVLAIADPPGDGRLHVVGPDGVLETVDVGLFSTPRPMLDVTRTRLAYNVADPATGRSLFIRRDLN